MKRCTKSGETGKFAAEAMVTPRPRSRDECADINSLAFMDDDEDEGDAAAAAATAEVGSGVESNEDEF